LVKAKKHWFACESLCHLANPELVLLFVVHWLIKSIYYFAIEARQVRGLTNEVCDELCAREWGRTKGDKIEVEGKDDTKERLGRSPDLGDWAAIIVEGARRLGFQIKRLESPETAHDDQTWKHDLALKARAIRQSYALIRS